MWAFRTNSSSVRSGANTPRAIAIATAAPPRRRPKTLPSLSCFNYFLFFTLGGVLGVAVLDVVEGPGLGYGALELLGVDVVDANGVADPALEQRHTLLPVAVLHGVGKTLRNRGNSIRGGGGYLVYVAFLEHVLKVTVQLTLSLRPWGRAGYDEMCTCLQKNARTSRLLHCCEPRIGF